MHVSNQLLIRVRGGDMARVRSEPAGATADTWPLIGRTSECRALQAAVLDRHRSGAVVTGEAGIGKTRLVSAVVQGLDRARFTPLRVAATPATQAIPFGALAHLLPADPPTVHANLIGWARDSLLGRADAGRRLLLCVDDAHVLDEVSSAVVAHLARTGGAFVLVTTRTRSGLGRLGSSLANDDVLRVELEGLSITQVHELLEAATGCQVDTLSAHRLWRVTLGNPLYLRELIRAAVGDGTLVEGHGIVRWEGNPLTASRLIELVEAQFAVLSADEREVLELVSLGDPLPLDTLSRITASHAIEAVEDAGLVTVSDVGSPPGSHLRVAHPIFAEIVRGQCPEVRRRRHLRELAAATEGATHARPGDLLRVALWHLDSGTGHDPAHLLRACRLAFAARDLPLATRFGWAALNAGGGVEAATTLATVLNYHERPDEADAALRSAGELVATDLDRSRLAVTHAYTLHYGLGRPDDAGLLLDDTLAAVDSPELRHPIMVQRGQLLHFGGHSHDALPWFEAVLCDSAARADVRAEALGLAAAALGVTGRHAAATALLDELFATADSWREVVPFNEPRAVAIRHLVELLAGELDAADAQVSAMHARALEEWNWDFVLGYLTWSRAQTARYRGRVAAAHRLCREAVSLLRRPGTAFGFLPACLGELAHIAALSGDVHEARSVLSEAESSRSASMDLFNSWIDVAVPWVRAMNGDLTGAITVAMENAHGARESGLVGFEIISLHDVVRLGGADDVVEALEAVAATADGPYPAACAAHARAAVDHDPAGLTSVAERFAALGMDLLAAEAAAQAATVVRASGSARAARALASRASALLAGCEGPHTPALADLRAPGLTRRERQVAHLAAAGRTSRQIADELVMSVRTVDNHLHHAYAKLGVDDRRGLAHVLAP